MICPSCNQEAELTPSNVHSVDLATMKVTQLHLCNECGKELEIRWSLQKGGKHERA